MDNQLKILFQTLQSKIRKKGKLLVTTEIEILDSFHEMQVQNMFQLLPQEFLS
jgi:hypothetical protein